jgi:NhaP-type Na+/H+ or K+/H+ antiporter
VADEPEYLHGITAELPASPVDLVTFTLWYLVVGVLLIAMAIAASMLKRLPLTSSMFYLAAGWALGPTGAALLSVNVIDDAVLLERVTEIAVIVSLFTAGLKLRLPLRDPRWRAAILLATLGMLVTVGGLVTVGIWMLGLPLGAAVLLGAVLAPTDPVLASDVQVEGADDSERMRFALTGEAGLNDGTAFPMVMLALGLAGAHELGSFGLRWLGIDVIWAIGAGLLTGTVCGTVIGRFVVYLRRVHREAVGLDEFLALGLIALSYGLALLIHSYGFLSVFAAGLALRRIEREHTGDEPPADVVAAAGAGEQAATDPDTATAYMAQAVLTFNEQLERIGEVAAVLLIGALLTTVAWSEIPFWFYVMLFAVVRPVAAFVGLIGTTTNLSQRAFIGWFGVRGIGSLYYLAFAITHGMAGDDARRVTDLVLAAVAVSIVVHGVSVTPLMRRYAPK